jgi:hypothetical protein
MSWYSVARPSAPRRTRALAHALVFAAAAVAAPAAARAQAPITFNGIATTDPSGVQSVMNCYVEGGVRFTVVGEACGMPAMGQPPALATYTPANGSYTGTPALFNNLGTAVDFTSVSGQPMSLFSIDLAPIFIDPSVGSMAGNMMVMFTGFRMPGMAGPATVTQSFSLSLDAAGLTRFVFSPEFQNLTSVRMAPGAPDLAVQFDNVNAAVIPEPGTVLLLGLGLAGTAAYARRRRAAA